MGLVTAIFMSVLEYVNVKYVIASLQRYMH